MKRLITKRRLDLILQGWLTSMEPIMCYLIGTLRRMIREVFRPPFIVVDIYGLERTMERFVICHRDEIVDNFFAASPVYERISRAERKECR